MKAMVKASLLGLVVLGASCSGGAEDSLAGSTETIEAAVSTTATIAPVDTPDTQDTPETEGTPETEDDGEAPADTEAEVRAAFERYRAVVREVNGDPDPADDRIEEVATGPILDAHTASIARWFESGQAVRFPESSVARADILDIELSNGVAIVTVCRVGDSYVLDLATGERSEEGTTTRTRIYTAIPESGIWKMESATDVGLIDGVGGCADR